MNSIKRPVVAGYENIHSDIVTLLEAARRADYGVQLIERLAHDLTARFGRGFSRPNLQHFRDFYLQCPVDKIRSTLSSKFPDM